MTYCCSKYRTLKTSSQTVSVQVQPVHCQNQPGQDSHGYDSVNYQHHYHWARSRQLQVSIRTLAINRALNAKWNKSIAIKQAITPALNAHRNTSVSIKQAINRALNATQAHKRSYQTSYKSSSNYATQGHKRIYPTSY